jgi:hypothetical protein
MFKTLKVLYILNIPFPSEIRKRFRRNPHEKPSLSDNLVRKDFRTRVSSSWNNFVFFLRNNLIVYQEKHLPIQFQSSI